MILRFIHIYIKSQSNTKIFMMYGLMYLYLILLTTLSNDLLLQEHS